jgi:hypothetical protein
MKEKIENFAKEHERGIRIAKSGLQFTWSVLGVIGVVMLVKDAKTFDSYWRKASKGAKVYLPACGEELLSLIEPYKGVVDVSGRKIDVTGALLFGNIVEE